MRTNKKQNVAAIYCRLSKEDEDKLKVGDESGSIQNQKLLLMEYAIKSGFTICKVYVDDDYSGFSDRPQFKQMLKDAEEGLFNIVLCKHQSRFTRDMELVEKYIHGYFIEWGIRFISLTDNVDTSIKGGKKSRQINGLINEWYCEDLSENVKSVIKAKRENGQFVGAFVSYGFKKNPQDKHKLIIDEEAAQVVRQIFSMYLSGMGAQAIAHDLTEQRVPTPAQFKKMNGSNFVSPNQAAFSTQHGAWAINTVRRILRNETYIGNLVQGREKSISFKTKKLVRVPMNEWTIVPNTHEPIIDKEIFYSVQRLINNKRSAHFSSIKNPNAKPKLLAGKVKCLDCGGTMHRGGQSRDGKVTYYRCQLAKKTKGRDCRPHNLNATKLEKLLEIRIKAMINTIMKNDSNGEVFQNVYKQVDSTKQLLEAKEKQFAYTENQISKIQQNITLMYADKLSGVISEDDYISFRATFEEEKQSLIDKKERLENEIQEYKESAKSHKSLKNLIDNYNSINVLTHEIVNDFVDNIQVGEKDSETKEQQIIINWNF